MEKAVTWSPGVLAPAQRASGRLWQWVFLTIVSAIILAPILMVIADSFDIAPAPEVYRFGMDNWTAALASREISKVLWTTLSIVVVRALLGFLIAIPLAWLVARTNIPCGRHLEFGFWIAFFMPSLAYIQGWTLLLEANRGLVNQLLASSLGWPPDLIDIYSYWGIIWVHLASQNVSALFVLLVVGFRNLDSSFEEASRVSGAGRMETLRRIVMPLSRPMISMLLVFALIRGMQSYEVEAVLGSPVGIGVYSTLVVTMITDEPPRLAQAGALSSLVLFLLIPLIVLHRVYVGRRNYATVSGKMKVAPVDLGHWRWPAFALVLFVVVLQTVVPLFATVAGSLMTRWGFFAIAEPWTLRWWSDVLANPGFASALLNTLAIGVLSGIAAAVVCFLIAYVIVRTEFPARRQLDFISWLPWAVPGVLLSLGLVALVLTVPALRMLHGSILVLVIAIILFRFPLGVQLLKTGLMQVNRELEEASTICGSHRATTMLRISVPLLMPMLVAVALMTFVTAVNEVSGVVLLASTETRTLSLMSLDYLIGSRTNKEAAAVITTIMILLCVGVALGARLFGISLGETVHGRRSG
jgi:iron(III) transport system permease protein